IVSGFVALSLSPMMCSKLLRHSEKHGRFYNFIERGLTRLTGAYRGALRRALRMRAAVLVVGFVVPSVAIFFLFGSLKQELSPTEDRGTVVGNFVAPEGSTIDYTDRYARMLEEIYSQAPAVNRYFMIAGSPEVSRGRSYVRFVDWDERDISAQEVADWLRPRMAAVRGDRKGTRLNSS